MYFVLTKLNHSTSSTVSCSLSSYLETGPKPHGMFYLVHGMLHMNRSCQCCCELVSQVWLWAPFWGVVVCVRWADYKLLLITTINYECTALKSFCSNKTGSSPPSSSPLPNVFRFKTLFFLNTSPIISEKKKQKHLVSEM